MDSLHPKGTGRGTALHHKPLLPLLPRSRAGGSHCHSWLQKMGFFYPAAAKESRQKLMLVVAL